VGVSGTAYPADQLPYIISGGVGGIFLLGLGAMMWLSADLRDEWRKLDRIDENLARRAGAWPRAESAKGNTSEESPSQFAYVGAELTGDSEAVRPQAVGRGRLPDAGIEQ
jgi:hypothetical protein